MASVPDGAAQAEEESDGVNRMAERRIKLRNENRSFPFRALHGTVDFLFVALMMLFLLVAIYMEMDINSVYGAADPKQWIQYKPDFPDDVLSFEELQEKNADVIGWLTIYGTNIDYPLLYPKDGNNNFYLDHNPVREPESSGTLFLDSRNSPDFTDFNTIIHGHHMAQHKMFGDLDLFLDEDFFIKHEFGNLYANDRDYGFQIVVMVKTDGYDWDLYRVNEANSKDRIKYINSLYAKAVHIRGIEIGNRTHEYSEEATSPITPDDKLLIFSTCNLGETNGRYIVVAKILPQPIENTFPEKVIKPRDNGTLDTYTLFNRYGLLPVWAWLGMIAALIIVTFILYRISRWRDKRRNAYD